MTAKFNGSVIVVINDKRYQVYASPFITKKFEQMLKHSHGKALAWFKKNTSKEDWYVL